MIMRRREYSKDKVKQMRVNRNTLKPIDPLVADLYAKKVGKLRAAGHFTIDGFKKLTKSRQGDLGGDLGALYETEVSFRNFQKTGTGDKPHISGYLESASDADKGKYRLKGWFNEDGTIRIELVD
jgi:hypothetical protein